MPDNKFHWLELAEWATLGSSAVGVIGSVITKQFIMAGVPLTVALSLNIINQKRLQRQIEHERTTISKIHQDLQSLNQQIRVLPSQKVNTDDFNQSLTRLASLEESIHSLSKLDWQVEELERKLSGFNEQLLTYDDDYIETQVTSINQRLQEIQPVYQYQLVFNRTESCEILLEALNQANERLILVCPWLSKNAIKDIVLFRIENLLKRNVFVEIGWGSLKDKGIGDLYNALPTIENLQKKYPGKCRLKFLGTHEKFLVCDNKFAMVGSHNFLTSGANGYTTSSERELGIRTDDTRIISNLIHRFDIAENLR